MKIATFATIAIKGIESYMMGLGYNDDSHRQRQKDLTDIHEPYISL